MASSAVLETCRQWVELALPALTAVLYDAQPGRPALPYATVELVGSRGMTSAPNAYATKNEVNPGQPDSHEFVVEQRRRGTVRVIIYGDGSHDLAEELETSLHRAPAKALLRAGAVSVYPLSDAIPTGEYRDTTWEESATIDFAVTYTAEDKSTVGIIETWDIDLTFNPPGGGA